MAYNYGRAEREWLVWKEKEEKQLRELGVDEDTIQRLHTYDWEQFKKERNYYRWQTNAGDADLWLMSEESKRVENADDLLDTVENERLREILQETDKQTLEMVVMKMERYTSEEIAQKLHMSARAVDMRIFRFKRNNFLGEKDFALSQCL